STYALAINNFTSTGNGFQLEWGGTVEFIGPEAEIATNPPDGIICLGDTIRFSDVSTVDQGIITDWGWTFGEGASQSIATTTGPHDIVYSTTGQKVVTLNIKSSLGCEVSDTRFITVDDCCPISLTVNVSAPCQSTTATASVQVQAAQPPLSYLWSNGQQDSIATGLGTGSYTVTVTDANGCVEVATFSVPVLVHFTAAFPADTSIITGTNATLLVVSDNPELQVSWSPQPIGAPLEGNPLTLMPLETTTYLVRAFIGDCSLSDSLTITVLDNLFEVPNAFTPNGDQMNDRFKPVLNGGTVIKLSVWSRWGELVYESNNANGWDGTFDGEAAPSDVYVYQLVVRLPNGEEKMRHGDVTLIR
ncbi:MAG: gliding motility-associated C-terminal domain-containing protein, partial [Saprospiraceae bacterium]|nr:gliding motility-associated C-terminal domain-containing protein [Saprospiraceae bacterium]